MIHLLSMNYEGLLFFQVDEKVLWLTLTPIFLLNVAFRGHLLVFLWKYAPDRPINKIFIFDQVLSFLSSLLIDMGAFLALTFGKPLYDIFGQSDWACMANYMTVLVYYVAKIMNGCLVAIYRLMCMKLGWESVQTPYFVKKIILLSGTITASITIFVGSVIYKRANGPVGQFCYGRTEEKMRIMSEYESAPTSDTVSLLLVLLILLISQVLVVAQIVAYVIIAYDRYKHDHGSEVISAQTHYKRRRGNVITFGGQLVTFGIESLTFGLAVVFVSIGIKWNPSTFGYLFFCLQSCIIGIVNWINCLDIQRNVLKLEI